MKRFLAIILTLAMLVGASPIAFAADGGLYGSGSVGNYYKAALGQTDQVDREAAAAFYRALETMDLASGKNLSVSDPAVISLAEAYASGTSDKLIRSFGAAVDSFRYDHMAYFYVDWDMLSITVGRKNGAYVVNLGTGRTDSYLLDKTADISGQISVFDSRLDAMAADVRAKAGDNATVKELAKAANDVVCDAVQYDFCDDPATGKATEASRYIRTAYGALVNGRAVCEGYSRLYKAVLNELGVACELVSGYYLNGESYEPHMWNYVQDEDGHWYAVDVTMNDSAQSAVNDKRKYAKYFWQTEELFAVDHMEDGKVSSVEYEMPYPDLYQLWETAPVEDKRFQYGTEQYNGTPAFWFNFDGKSAEELMNEDGLYMALRTATTNTGELEWWPWVSVQEYNRLIEPEPAPSDTEQHKTYFLGENISMPILEVGVFDIPEDVDNGVARSYSEQAVATHLIATVSIKNPSHDSEYIAPAYITSTTPTELFQRRQDIKETQHIQLVYDMPLRVIAGEQFALTWDVSSYNNRDLSLDAVKANAKLENVQFDGDRTISFDFTPSKAFNHNMIFYHFTPHNIVNVKADGEDGVALNSFAVMYEYKDSIACCKIYNDGRLYVNSYAQPSIAMNGDLSTSGWTYVDESGVERKVSESQRSQVALVVTRPDNSDNLIEEATGAIGGAAVQAKTYEIDLNICGKILSIPNGSYMKLNLGIPDEFADFVGEENITFKLYHFKRNADGTLDYDHPEEIPCVLTPYGLMAEVHSFSPYVLVAVDNSKLSQAQRDTSKSIALVNNGHGGKVEGNPVVTLEENGTATYTLVPDAGYGVEWAALNGEAVAVENNRITLTYDQLAGSNTLEVGFVAQSVQKAEAEEGIVPVTPGIADAAGTCTVTFDTGDGSAISAEQVQQGGTANRPADPTRSGYTFEGWYTDKQYTALYDFGSPVHTSITLYAKWTENKPSGSGSTAGSSGGSYGGGSDWEPSGSSVGGITVTSPDQAIAVTRSAVADSVVREATASVKDNAAVAVIGGQTCAVHISAQWNGTAAAVSSFDQPLTVSVPVKADALKDVTDTGKLTLAQVTKDEWGNTVLTYMGGSYDGQTGAFTAYVDEPGDYILVADSNIRKVELQIGKQTGAVNGKRIVNDVAPILYNSRTMVPLRFVGETLGAQVDWNGETGTVTLTVDGVTMEMTIGERIDGFDVAPILHQARTMVPIRYIGEALGANVIYVPGTQEIVVVK